MSNEQLMMAVLKLHKTIGVKVGRVQVGGGAPVVAQSMTMTDTADARGTAAAVHRACRSRIRDGAGDGQPARSRGRRARDQAADARRRLRRAAHRRLPLQRPSPADDVSRLRVARSTNTASTRATSAPAGGATSSSRRSARWRSTTDKPVRIGVNGGSLNQELVVAKMQENTGSRARQDLRRDHQRVHGARRRVESTALAIEQRSADAIRSSSRARRHGRAI